MVPGILAKGRFDSLRGEYLSSHEKLCELLLANLVVTVGSFIVAGVERFL